MLDRLWHPFGPLLVAGEAHRATPTSSRNEARRKPPRRTATPRLSVAHVAIWAGAPHHPVWPHCFACEAMGHANLQGT